MKKLILLSLLFLILLIIYSFVLYAQNISSKLTQAQTLMDQEKYADADKIFDEIINTNFNKLDILYNAAYCKLYMGRPDIAIDYLERFLAKNKDNAEVYNLLGLGYTRIDENAKAMSHFSTAIKLEKNLYEAYFNRGILYLQMDSIDLAIKDFNYAKKDKKINPELYFTSGNLYSILKQYDSALIDLEKIVKYKSTDPYYLALLGDAYFMTAGTGIDTAKLEKSIEYYTKSLILDSKNVTVLKNRSFAYDKLEQTEKGELDKERILQIQKEKFTDLLLSIRYKILSVDDETFTINIPEYWRTFISKNNEVDIIIFFDTNFNYSQNDEFYNYDFGGQLLYYPKYFETNLLDTDAIFNLRLEKYTEYLDKQKIFCQTKLKNYNLMLRKTFNPNLISMRHLSKHSFYSQDDIKLFEIEYFCITTTGKLIILTLWMPFDNYFQYELLFDYIYESLKINEK